MKKICCFGELLLRLSPQAGGGWIDTAAMPAWLGGAELNVAQALAQWRQPVKYITALPGNSLAGEILQYLALKNIDISGVVQSGNRIGTYYMPQGAGLNNTAVIYDRAHSAFSELRPGDIDWPAVLDDCGWLHFSAICPAISENLAALCKEMLEAAHQKGITISVDLNYRSKLWQYQPRPELVMQYLLPYCHIIMGNIWSVETLAGIPSTLVASTGATHAQLVEAAGNSMLALHQCYPHATTFACTFRLEHEYFGVLQHGPAMAISKTFALTQVIDRAGSGDCFMAGLIYGLRNALSTQDTVNFAAAAAVGKLAEAGDATRQTIENIKAGI